VLVLVLVLLVVLDAVVVVGVLLVSEEDGSGTSRDGFDEELGRIWSWGAASRGDRCTKGGDSESIFCVEAIVFASTLEVKLCRIDSLVILLLLLLLLDELLLVLLLFFAVVVLLLEEDASLDEEDASLLLLLEDDDVEDEETVEVRPSCSCSVLSNECMDGKRLARVSF